MAGIKLNTTSAQPNSSASNTASTSSRPIPPPAQPNSSFSAAPPASQPPATSSSSSTSSTAAQSSNSRPRQPQQPPLQPPAHAHAQPKPRNASFTTQQQPQSDPDAPPHSPITPPLQPLKSTTPIPPPTIPPNFASLGGRAPLTHNTHPATVPSAPPPPIPLQPLDPVDFEDNVDVIALRTAINILQMQKRRAEADIRQLRDVKESAAADPMAFYRDLVEGRVGKGGPETEQADNDDSDSDSDEDSSGAEGGDAKDVKMEDGAANGESSTAPGAQALKPSLMKGKATATSKGKATATAPTNNNNGASSSGSAPSAAAPPWTAKFPEAQNIYRCPPINWSQYAVEGEALDKLHHEQQTRPTLGMPALLGANGTYEFTGVGNPDDGKKIVEGVAAPFDPFRDKLLTKPKGGGGSRRGA